MIHWKAVAKRYRRCIGVVTHALLHAEAEVDTLRRELASIRAERDALVTTVTVTRDRWKDRAERAEARVRELETALTEYAEHAADSGWLNLAEEIRRRLRQCLRA